MTRCPHPENMIQEFTDLCLACSRNINESDRDYLWDLLKEKERRENIRLEKVRKQVVKKMSADEMMSRRIEELELELGIVHPGNKAWFNAGGD